MFARRSADRKGGRQRQRESEALSALTGQDGVVS
jgi:hypothetical protein